MTERSTQNILYFFNRTDAPVAFDYGRGRITLYKKGDIIRDREGNAVVDPFFLKPEIRRMGIEPFYKRVLNPTQKRVTTEQVAEKQEASETPVDDVDPADNVPKTPDTPANTHDEVAEPVGETEKTRKGVAIRVLRTNEISEKESSDPKRLVVIKKEGKFYFKLDHYQAHSPAKMKRHIKKKFGEDLLEHVEFKVR